MQGGENLGVGREDRATLPFVAHELLQLGPVRLIELVS
jgi:hypothetical protein